MMSAKKTGKTNAQADRRKKGPKAAPAVPEAPTDAAPAVEAPQVDALTGEATAPEPAPAEAPTAEAPLVGATTNEAPVVWEHAAMGAPGEDVHGEHPQPQSPDAADAATPAQEAEGPKTKPSRARRAKTKATAAEAPKKLSALDAALRVLEEAGQAMTCPEMIAAMTAKGYWISPGGKTPQATLYSAILREITTKGDASRFVKAAPGRFACRANP
jgi:hypothetical protein